MHSPCRWSCLFLLVISVIILPCRLALAAPPTRRSPSSSSEEASSSAAASIVWSSPAPGDRFGPGDTITGEWQVTSESQNQKVVSPSFRLCAGGEDGCGATVWPEVVAEESTGYYYVSLTAPDVNTESGYYLQMKDDFSHMYASPIFNLTPTPQKKDKPAAPEPEVAQPQPRPDQAPLSSSSSSSSHGKSNGATHSDPIAPAPPAAAAASAPATTPADTGGTAPNSNPSLTPGSISNSSSSGGRVSGPPVAGAHNAPPTAALAVPLSLAGAIILLAGGLALHHRRKLAAEKELCSARLAAAAASSSVAPSSSSSSSSEPTRSLRPPVGLALDLGRRTTTSSSSSSRSSSRRDKGRDHYGDSEKALFAARALLRGGFSDRAYDAYYDRRHPEGVAAYATYSRARSYAHGAPEPRLRTRQPDPLALTREFTVPRRRAHPPSSSTSSPSPSSHPSHHRGIFGDRHGVRRSGSSNYNGGGASSLWRSLSIARRKAPPSSASLASPALTESVASVTSEVLPSYLPSPNFVGGIAQVRGHEHGASTGDFGFETVPLSPPPPPPLHTRGEAIEPDDSRMRELRGVYEAVAHALGSMRRV